MMQFLYWYISLCIDDIIHFVLI